MNATEVDLNTQLSEALAEWKKSVLTELKDVPFEKKLVTRTFEEIAVQPLYTRADVQMLRALSCLPGQPPFLRGIKRGSNARPWKIAQEIATSNLDEYNQILLSNLRSGQDTAVISPVHLSSAGTTSAPDSASECRLPLQTMGDFSRALAGVDLEAVDVYLHAGSDPRPFAAVYLAFAEEQSYSLKDLKGSITADPLGEFLAFGDFPHDLGAAYDIVANWTRWAAKHVPNLRTIRADGKRWGNAGASATQELAFALGAAAEYIRALLARGDSLDRFVDKFSFQFSIGSQFFSEIAKFRAFRPLWTRVLMAFGGEPRLGALGAVAAVTGSWNKTLLDPHVNILRATTEALSAVLGGCDSLSITPFDQESGHTTELSRRIALNVHTLMAEEFGLTQPADPAGGSWYIEKLTDEIARGAWKIFQEIEHRGGMALCLRTGYAQELAEKVAQTKRTRVATRATPLVGTNLFPHPKSGQLECGESAQVQPGPSATPQSRPAITAAEGKSEWDYSAAIAAARKNVSARELLARYGSATGGSVVVTKLDLSRAAKGFEAVRRACDSLATRLGHQPRVYLAKLGSPLEYKARADFSSSFFLVGGFSILPSTAFTDAEVAAQAASQSSAEVVVLCTTDESQRTSAEPFARALKRLKPGLAVVLAGLPNDPIAQASFRAAGFDTFIHARGNAEEILTSLINQLGK